MKTRALAEGVQENEREDPTEKSGWSKWAREGASGGSLKGSAEPNESEALHEASNPEGKLAYGSELYILRQVGV
jgi:hypothetical protein